ncbi:MAG: hypothetical protein Kow0042_28960 [Calditrichia bacterium]
MHHYHRYPHYHGYHPWGWYSHHCFHPGWGYYPYHFPYWCPLCYQPYHLCTCYEKYRVVLPRELFVDSTSSPGEVLIGGVRDVQVGLEYMPEDGATSPSVKLTFTAPDGTSSVWEETSISPGYHVKRDFSKVAPGSKIKLEVNEAVARLRWCEVETY